MNPFDDPDGRFLVVVNDEEQHSLWPAHVPVPPGWKVRHPEDTRDNCLAHVERQWPDIRPLSLRRSTAASGR